MFIKNQQSLIYTRKCLFSSFFWKNNGNKKTNIQTFHNFRFKQFYIKSIRQKYALIQMMYYYESWTFFMECYNLHDFLYLALDIPKSYGKLTLTVAVIGYCANWKPLYFSKYVENRPSKKFICYNNRWNVPVGLLCLHESCRTLLCTLL